MNDSSIPHWLSAARTHATKYLTLFVNNPGLEKIIKEFDPKYLHISDPSERLHYLSELVTREWDFRKGRERWEVTETFEMDNPGSKLGATIHEGAREAEMASASTATLKHYSVVAVLGGANKSPYNRLKYALEQHVTCDKMAYLGSERALPEAEQEKVHADYAPGAVTEFDLGVAAFSSLMSDQIISPLEYQTRTPQARVAYFHQRNNVPIMLLSAPPQEGRERANTTDTYDFLRLQEGEALNPTKNVLFATAAVYRYGQYFDAVREISLQTGADIEVIGFDPEYGGLEFKPSQFLQELKSAVDAAVRLHNSVHAAD